ncbi:MAG TPA: protein-disulfide reductase DsbD domain-containing protein [Chitinophagaceae bacterium]
MRKLAFTACILLALPALVFAQTVNPVKWDFTAKKISEKVYEVHLKATIEPGWHIYAQDAGEGPVPTSFTFTKNPLTALDGKVKEVGKKEKAFDKNFNSELKYYEHSVDFVQKVTVRGMVNTQLKGSLEFMVCNDRQCLPPRQEEFALNLSGK